MQENKMPENKLLTHGKTKTVKGTILLPELASLRLILTPCSQAGKPDSKLHTILNKKWRTVAADLKGWCAHNVDFKLGNLRQTAVQSDVWVIHALYLDKEGKVDEKALESCVKKLADLAKYEKGSVHVSTLLTEENPKLVELLQKLCLEKGTPVFFYEETSEAK